MKIKRYGQLGLLLVDGRDKSTILGGNHAYEVMRELGMEEARVEYRTPKDDSEALELVILHNERYASWVEDGLAELLYQYKESIDLTRYSIDLGKATDLKKVLARYGNTDEDDFDVENNIPDEPRSERGKVYQLGRHRMMCGDSTDSEAVTLLMNGQEAVTLLTDPPYGVSYEGNPNGEEWKMIENDDLRGDSLQEFLYKAFDNAYKHTIPTASAYIFYASSNHRQFEDALNKALFMVRQQLIWVKGMVIGNSDYHWTHEPILYCEKDRQRASFYGDRTNTTTIKEIRYERLAEMTKEELVTLIHGIKERSTIINATQDTRRGQKYMHPTQKPLAVIAPLIKNSSMPGEIVLDLFGGSGSTLIASHQLDRICYTMEYDPKFADVIRKRYAHYIGEDDRWEQMTPEV